MEGQSDFLRSSSFLGRWVNEVFAGVTSGLVMALSFPPFPLRFLVIFSLLPILGYYIRYFKKDHYIKRSVILGASLGIAFFLTLLYWVSNLIPASSARMPWLMVPALGLLVAYLSCYPILFSLVLGFLVRRFGKGAIFAAPALWSVSEFIRSSGELGFSWGILASSPAIHPEAIQSLTIYGPFGLSMIIAFVNMLIALAIFDNSLNRRIFTGAISIIIVLGYLYWGKREIADFDREIEVGADPKNTIVVQPNTDLDIKWKKEFRDSIFNQIEELAFDSVREDTELMIFPETAAPVSISHANQHRRWLQLISDGLETDLLIGFVDHKLIDGKWKSYNSAGLFDQRGNFTYRYDKINLLPFGERIPFSQYLPFLGKLNFGQANFVPGEEATIFHSKAGKFGVLICFESTFSGYSRKYIKSGADFLVNITNDGWFGSKAGPLQHAESVILRSVENRTPVLRSANTGISMCVDPVGRIKGKIGLNQQGALSCVFDFSNSGDTIYCKYGHAIFWSMVLINVVMVFIFLIFPLKKS